MAARRTATEQIDLIYTTTWQLRRAKVYDSIFKQTPFWNLMSSKGRMDTENGGRFIEEPINYDTNSSITTIGRATTVTLQDIDHLTASKWDWKNITGHIQRFYTDEQMNRGTSMLIKIITAKIDNLQGSFAQEMERMLFADGTGNGGLEIDGLDNIIAENPTTGTVGGINRATSGNDFWQNQFKDMALDVVSTVLLKRMNNIFNNCGIYGAGIQRFPDILISAQNVYEAYTEEATEIQQIIMTESGKRIAELGFGEQQYRGQPMTWSPECKAGSLYFINSASLRWVADTIENFTLGEWLPIVNQPRTRVAHAMLTGNLVCNTPRKNGVLFNMVL